MCGTFLLQTALTEENMASCSRAFRKPKNAEKERNVFENATPISTREVTNWSLKIFFRNGRMVGKSKIQPSCAFATG